MLRKDRYFNVPLDTATAPKDGEALVEHWWAVHPERGLTFFDTGEYAAPQCNRDRNVSDIVVPKTLPDHEVRQIPVVYLAHAEAARLAFRQAAATSGAGAP